MLIKFFPSGKGAGAGPVCYLVAERVLAYDGNRDLVRDADGQPLTVTRDPLPEALRGDPTRTEALIDASRHQWTYRAGVISFAAEDAPSNAQQAEVMDAFERLAFAGLDGEQFDMLWVRHSHEDRVELHFCTPRLELTTGRSLNIAPPGYQDAYDSLRDLMNQRHGWADPMELERAQEVRDTIEAPTRAQGRDELHAWILDQISMGLIEDRASMLDALADAGFDLPRVGKAYLTAQDPETGERWRLKGEIFHEDWQADPAEREIERRAGHDTPGLRRLDGIPAGELQERFDDHCERRAAYHQERYAQLPEREQELVRDADRTDQALADDLSLRDLGSDRDGDRLDDGRELVLDVPADTLGVDGTGADAVRPGGTDLADAGPRQDRVENLHAGGVAGHLHQDRGEMNDDAPDSIGTRLARLRRAVGDGLRNLSRRIERLGDTLDQQDRDTTGWLGRLRDLAHSFAGRINDGLAGLVEQSGDLQRAGRAVERELEASEGRRREAETELNELQIERGHSHGLGR
ncbi:relaxase/mobilization nuclease domain-containing protein [Aestuariivita sp.]|uniref:relaxase/mobilization nuclease domain-containing protein n=1 Tax=Aestuariivita sp. TaxID=1872407 RepID=UPI002170C78F|nr:relaxase/mobilization nuclease domain-containing protein [Aestuariivita sp.]MCE8006305.1 relaxase/mobilization nuclease domain-containing protein [Aestuariivita sp.]